MSSAFYDNFRNTQWGGGTHGQLNLDTADIRTILRDEGADALNLADQDLADIIAGARIAVSAALAATTVGVAAVGAFDHDNVTYTSVTGASVESIDYYNHTGTETTSQLIANLDESSITGLPVTPNGGNIIYTIAAGGAFQIT